MAITIGIAEVDVVNASVENKAFETANYTNEDLP